jgi:imidazolonepropionase-like amidohydrolase
MGRMGEQDVTGKRSAKKKPGEARRRAAPAGDDGKPKEPKTDQNLEPLRAAIEKRGALVVRCNRAPAIQDVVELLEKEEIPYVLQGVQDLVDDPALLGKRRPAVLVGPDAVADEKGEVINSAARFSDRGMPILFGSGDCAGSVLLPMHAAYTVRYGLSPADALSAMTLWPARAFGLQDRIGSLEKGKDADFVVFSGSPFEPQSRVLLVGCNGVIVFDQREAER